MKAAIQREGRIKLSAVPAREITAMAEAYVLSHREIIVEVRARWSSGRLRASLERLHARASFERN